MADTATTTLMRDVTDEEVAFYQENGWAKLEQLIPEAVATQMLDAVREAMEQSEAELGEGGVSAGGQVHDRVYWRDWHFPGRDDGIEPFRSLAYSREIGHNAQRFIGREVPINYHADMMAVKMPTGHAASGPTGFHQDWVELPVRPRRLPELLDCSVRHSARARSDALSLRLTQGRSARQDGPRGRTAADRVLP